MERKRLLRRHQRLHLRGLHDTGCYTLTFYDGHDGMKFGGSMVLTNGAGDVIAEITEDENEFGRDLV